MTTDEFDAWIPDAVRDYAAEHVQVGNVSPATAHQWATAQFDQLLPEGTQTQGHHLLIVEEAGTGSECLWLYIPAAGNKRAFVYDLEVDPAHRGQGAGQSRHARRRGLRNVVTVLRPSGCTCSDSTTWRCTCKYVDESEDKFVTADLKLSDWDKYVDKINQMALDDYMEIQQAAYDRYRKS